MSELARRFWALLSKALSAIFAALFSVLLFPLRVIAGVGPRPSAVDVAEAAVAAAEAEPAPVPRYELGDLIRAHAAQRSERAAGLRTARTEAVLAPLPSHVEEWMGRMDRQRLNNCCASSPRYLEAHIRTEPGRRGPYDATLGSIHAPAIVPAAAVIRPHGGDDRSGRSGGGGQRAKPVPVDAVLAQLGIDVSDFPAYPTPRPR